jgi:hypothetical protein
MPKLISIVLKELKKGYKKTLIKFSALYKNRAVFKKTFR